MPSGIALVAGEQRATESENVSVMVAGAPPPAVVIEAIARFGWYVAHVYGMTESYGPAIFIERQPERDRRDLGARRALKVRQGLRGPMLKDVMVADPETTTQVPADAVTVGKLLMPGNTVMKGYPADPAATDAAFEGGWLHTSDLAVRHLDGHVEIRDRAKDFIIPRGENIATIENRGCPVRTFRCAGRHGRRSPGRFPRRNTLCIHRAEFGRNSHGRRADRAQR